MRISIKSKLRRKFNLQTYFIRLNSIIIFVCYYRCWTVETSFFHSFFFSFTVYYLVLVIRLIYFCLLFKNTEGIKICSGLCNTHTYNEPDFTSSFNRKFISIESLIAFSLVNCLQIIIYFIRFLIFFSFLSILFKLMRL